MIGRALLVLSFLVPLASAAQQHGDTVFVSPEESRGTDTVISAVPNSDTTHNGGAVDSESLERASVKADPVVLRSIPDSKINGWKRSKDFAYANDPAYWRKETPQAARPNGFLRWLGRILGSEGFRYFILSLLAAVLLYAIIRIIMENNLRMFYRSPKKAKPGLDEAASPLEEDLDQQLERALAAKDHRLAVRWLYLKALRLLNERSLIKYHIQATNREYVQQLSGVALGGPFRWLTVTYERVWYGEIPVSDAQFEKVYPYFQDFYKSIGQS